MQNTDIARNRRIPFIGGNWKMNPASHEEAVSLALRLSEILGKGSDCDVALAPPYLSLVSIREMIKGLPIQLMAQNGHPETAGAFTGEVSISMLTNLCEYVIVGHSERRRLFGEDDELVNRKVRSSIRLGLRPVLCVGETLEERSAKMAAQVVEFQLNQGLLDVPEAALNQVVVAYEPLWAIGTGEAATPETAQEMLANIRLILSGIGEHGRECRIIYGGSVNADNADAYASEPDIDGALVGGASLKPEEFAAIVQAFATKN